MNYFDDYYHLLSDCPIAFLYTQIYIVILWPSFPASDWPNSCLTFLMLHSACYTARSSCGARTRENPHWKLNCPLPNFEASALTTVLVMQRYTQTRWIATLLPPWQSYLLGKGGYVFGSVGLSVCLSVCLFVDNVTQKVVNGLGWSFMAWSWVVKWRTG